MDKRNVIVILVLVATTYAQVQSYFWDLVIPRDNTAKFCRKWYTGFESWNDFNGFDITPDTSGSASNLVQSPVHSGKYAFQGLIKQIENNEHKAYPMVEFYKTAQGPMTGPAYIEVFVYLSMDIQANQWLTLAEISSDNGNGTYPGNNLVSVTLGPDNYLSLYQANGGPVIYQNKVIPFPRNTWVNVTIYINFDPVVGIAAVWQNGALMYAQNVNGGSGAIYQLHAGMYAMNLIPAGSVYNDDMTIYQTIRGTETCPDGSSGTPFTTLANWGKTQSVLPNSTTSIYGISFLFAVVLAVLALVL